jgi:hypothetical protein
VSDIIRLKTTFLNGLEYLKPLAEAKINVNNAFAKSIRVTWLFFPVCSSEIEVKLVPAGMELLVIN